ASVKVGVVSGGVSGLASAQAAGELPAVQVLSSDPSNDEGTAMLEIVYDCAPGATLAFASAAAAGSITSLSFMQAVNALRSAGAAIIVDDVILFSDPYFEDGPTALNDRTVGLTAIRVSAAGNLAQAHYQGTFSPGAFDSQIPRPGTRHDFGGGDTLLRYRAPALPAGAITTIILQWGNRFGSAGDDYDLCVRQTSGALLACSQLLQNGNDDPMEVVIIICTGASGLFCALDIQITLVSGSGQPLELYCNGAGCSFDQFNVRADSIFGHQAVPEVLAVAAVRWNTPSVVEPYSSAGPSTILFPAPETRAKPDLTGVDCVATSRPPGGLNPFCGTSAAAPHVAGVAALLMQAMGPSASVQSVRDTLKATAMDLGSPGPDSDFGFGLVDALAAVQSVPPSGGAGTLYGADGGQGNPSNLYILNPANGTIMHTIGSIGFALTGLAVHPITGVLYGSTSNNSPSAPGSLISINKTTGQGTLIGSFGFPSGCGGGSQSMADLTFTRDGTLYGFLEACNDDLYTVNSSTGAATKVGEFGSSTFGSGLAANGCNMIFYAGFGDKGGLTILNRRTGLGVTGPIMNGPLGDSIGALTFDANGMLYGLGINTNTSPRQAFLYTINPGTGAVANLGRTVDRLDTIAFENAAAPTLAVVSAVLPASRSVQVNTAATAFVTIINAGTATAKGVCLSVDSSIPVSFQFQTTDPTTNLPNGTPNTPANIAAGQFQTFVISLTPTAALSPTDVNFTYAGSNTVLASTVTGLNTLLLSGSTSPAPDIVALAATLANDGIVNLPGATGSGAFAVATSNVGASASITANVDTGAASLPVTLTICQTNPISGACLAAPSVTVTTQINAGATPTFGIFVKGNGTVGFDPAAKRVFVRFKDGAGVTRGSTSVAVRTQ
ncbi:MAG TPA: S8 family serine peptidase, partial [Methylomirabilota bacterium]|nr:S8 family serine peptidase [Methylomirabilota bacterium]